MIGPTRKSGISRKFWICSAILRGILGFQTLNGQLSQTSQKGSVCQFFAFVLNSEIQSQTGQKTGIAAVSRFQIANPEVSLHNIHYGT